VLRAPSLRIYHHALAPAHVIMWSLMLLLFVILHFFSPSCDLDPFMCCASPVIAAHALWGQRENEILGVGKYAQVRSLYK
jgi:hypothetical protein